MRILLLIVIAMVPVANGATNGVYHLPIMRTTSELDWRWIATAAIGKNYPMTSHSQYPLFQAFADQKATLEGVPKHYEVPPRISSHGIPSGEDLLDFWTIYTAPVSLGNPPLSLTALVDTSWAPFFVPSANCTFDPDDMIDCIKHPLYNSSLSSTYHADLSPVEMIYWGLEGVETYGRISSDNLHVSGLEIKNQIFEEATKWYPGALTSDDVFDTVLGLALRPTWDDWGNFSAPGPFQNMITQHLLRQNIFSLTLPRTDEEKGELVFGGLPEGVTRETLVEVPLNLTRGGEGDDLWDFYTSNGWSIPVESIHMTSTTSNKTLPVLSVQQIAVVSSSYSYIGLPSEAVKKINEFLGLTDGRTWVDCNIRSSLPDLDFTFRGESHIKLTAEDYLLDVYDRIYQKRKCVSNFGTLGHTGDSGMILLGSPFLNGIYSVFDADRKSISFGNR